ncbi:hypothetical protein K7X08_029755 [Anisodus acutangulus]|uniref:KIB1-4 beta-propeller domain-containing protein n=1 Tax=Anisodus acutangulus TaxID=402998 RepID=A0A9Q1L3K5_9SOLA|nr:hypothetical protein K7X08_029755 [Anisodus acutangulus]
MGNWAELSHDLIAVIAKRIKEIEDYIVFGAVCTSWRTAATKDNFDVLLSPQVPLLLLADKVDDYLEFYSLRKKFHAYCSQKLRGLHCYPSEGSLFTMTTNGDYNLLHTFSRKQIQLPSRQLFLREFEGLPEVELHEAETYRCIDKAILSVNPSVTSDYVLMISYFTYYNRLAFWRPGDLNWTSIDN